MKTKEEFDKLIKDCITASKRQLFLMKLVKGKVQKMRDESSDEFLDFKEEQMEQLAFLTGDEEIKKREEHFLVFEKLLDTSLKYPESYISPVVVNALEKAHTIINNSIGELIDLLILLS